MKIRRVRFDRNTDAAVKEEMMNRIYWYLDTGSDWRFTLYDYDGVLPARVDKVPGSCVYEQKQTPVH